MSKKTNIVMIGMPASGKSTVGKRLAKKLGENFLDVDLLIQENEGMALQEIINQKGNDYFKKIEDETLASLDVENTVISPGGSAIYYEKAMSHLKEVGIVVYLNVPFKEIERRMGNLETRGIVFPDGMGLIDLYNERCPLYEKWADITVEVGSLSLGKTVDKVIGEIKG